MIEIIVATLVAGNAGRGCLPCRSGARRSCSRSSPRADGGRKDLHQRGEPFGGRRAGLRGGTERILSALGALMPLGQEDRQKIASSLSRAGFRSSESVTVVLGAKVIGLLSGVLVGVIFLSGFRRGLLGVLIGLGGGRLDRA